MEILGWIEGSELGKLLGLMDKDGLGSVGAELGWKDSDGFEVI